MEKHLCECGNLAVWWYMPTFQSGNTPYFCDDCVPRGCECRNRFMGSKFNDGNSTEEDYPEGTEGEDWRWVEHGKIWCYIDTEGRDFPCEDFLYNENGYER